MNDGGKEVWQRLPVAVTRGGADESSWTLSFEWPPGTPHSGVPLFGVEAVHAPFDYVALDQEIELFQAKATAEGALIKAVRTNAYEGLAATVAETRGVVAKLQQAPADTSEKALAEVRAWAVGLGWDGFVRCRSHACAACPWHQRLLHVHCFGCHLLACVLGVEVAVGGGQLFGAARERSHLLRAPARRRWPLRGQKEREREKPREESCASPRCSRSKLTCGI